MLAKARRLSAKQVQAVLRSGLRARSPLLSCRFVGAREGESAFAAVVPLRIAGAVVKRNKLRRALYDAIASAPKPPVKAVVMLEKNPTGELAPSLRADIVDLFTQIRSAKRT